MKIGEKISAFGGLLTKAAGGLGDATLLELDSAAAELTEEYVRSWIKGRIKHNEAMSRKIGDDTVYLDITNYIVKISSGLFLPRLWNENGIEVEIWNPLQEKQHILDFVYRGASMMHARVLGKATDTTNQTFMTLAKHVADSLSIMSNSNSGFVPAEYREVFPTFTTLEKFFTNNPWLLFVYYLCRIDMFELMSKE